jgi:hypothetical protein
MHIESLKKRLEQSHKKLLEVLNSLDSAAIAAEQGEHWTILQVVEHLYLVERRIQIPMQAFVRKGGYQERTPAEPLHINRALMDLDFEQVLTIPTVEKAEPKGDSDLETLVGKLAKIRQKTYGFLDYGATHQLSESGFNHSYLGYLSFYDWFYLIALHEQAHVYQIEKLHRS